MPPQEKDLEDVSLSLTDHSDEIESVENENRPSRVHDTLAGFQLCWYHNRLKKYEDAQDFSPSEFFTALDCTFNKRLLELQYLSEIPEVKPAVKMGTNLQVVEMQRHQNKLSDPSLIQPGVINFTQESMNITLKAETYDEYNLRDEDLE